MFTINNISNCNVPEMDDNYRICKFVTNKKSNYEKSLFPSIMYKISINFLGYELTVNLNNLIYIFFR